MPFYYPSAMGDYKAEDGLRETVKLTREEVETLADDEDNVTIETESKGEVILYCLFGDHKPFDGISANSGDWDELLTGEWEELTWYHIPLRVVMADNPTQEITLDVDADTAEEVAWGIIGRAGQIHDNPDGEHEDVARELRALGYDVLEQARNMGDDSDEPMTDKEAIDYFTEELSGHDTGTVIMSAHDGVDLYAAAGDTQHIMAQIDVPDGWRVQQREHDLGIEFIRED